jgi:hypothetical protein
MYDVQSDLRFPTKVYFHHSVSQSLKNIFVFFNLTFSKNYTLKLFFFSSVQPFSQFIQLKLSSYVSLIGLNSIFMYE